MIFCKDTLPPEHPIYTSASLHMDQTPLTSYSSIVQYAPVPSIFLFTQAPGPKTAEAL